MNKMTSTPASKRRRLNDNAVKTLSKPFVSPLKPPGQSAPLQQGNNAVHITRKPSSLAQSTAADPSGTPAKVQKEFSGKEANEIPVLATRPLQSHAINARKFKTKPDPTELALQRSLARLEMQSRAMQNEVDTLNQAIALQNSSTDADLEELTLKWKLASQAAAEELFGTVKERVNRMGGVAAWRQSERAKHDRASEFGAFDAQEDDDADCEFDSQGEELPEDEQEWRKAQKRKARQEAKDAADVADPPEQEEGTAIPVWREVEEDHETFTIDMMLRSMNVDLDLIGYEKYLQRWTS